MTTIEIEIEAEPEPTRKPNRTPRPGDWVPYRISHSNL